MTVSAHRRLARSVSVRPAFDKRSDEPYENYGVGGVEFIFRVEDADVPTAYVLFRLGTNWMLPHVYVWWRTLPGHRPYREEDSALEGRVVATHWLTDPPPAAPSDEFSYDGSKRQCEDNAGRWCDGDGHYLLSDEWAKVLLEGGTDALWPVMEDFFREAVEPHIVADEAIPSPQEPHASAASVQTQTVSWKPRGDIR